MREAIMEQRNDAAGRVFLPLGEMTEVTLLLPARQAAALEAAATRRGLSVGQLLRQLVRTSLQETT
jgi:hypothetical protein